MKIQVHNKDKTIRISNKNLIELTNWLCKELKLNVQTLDIIFTDDQNLREMHEEFLSDNHYTDVMTFNLGPKDSIEGEIYISKERALENASHYNVSPVNEICRLITHACLHLAGYEDNNQTNLQKMKKKEDEFLSIVLTKFLN
jgi:rRNA maturation RNase YbeY